MTPQPRELSLRDTNGILGQPWIRPLRTSAGLGWPGVYVSTQRERPYRAEFGAAPSHVLILHLNGPVQVRRGHLGLTSARTVPPGGFFLHPAGKDLTVELGGDLDTTHVYVSDEALQEAHDGPAVRLTEELGAVDPLLEQLVLALDGVLRRWEPTARTYVDQLTALVAGQLAQRHSSRRGTAGPPPPARSAGLSDRQLAQVRELLEERLAEPVPLAAMAAVAGLSVSQFGRQFKARVGLAPHQYLLRLRVDTACRLLRERSLPIASVATRCGFSHQEHLTRVMRRHLETTPAAIRRDG
ncbi:MULTISPECIES: helix-turn-helix domain-containing protein [Dactylosporangium]|uniref:AraC family transcriptional regulator n=2 Tax=Dactylosporangium TaxID=35753 RepID=A0A9W6NSN2_9ACTN|nr:MULTISPECIES: AraC family transcriptional regulator [Dactylosporangium]UWZ48479.1 helix-turn-helix transcriptional regulator [Dactylosporangium matsuzakiense]GLL08530.1 AraC family transcriptional regulator [Dactylosporangium matsuzakiense]